MTDLRATGMKNFLASMVGVDGCWEWPKYRNAEGYGLTKLNGKTTVATRVAYQLAIGPIPAGLNVCHDCDNPPCCRPDHFFLGTQKQNCQDAKAKGRHSHGTRNGIAKLNEQTVRFIRSNAKAITQVALAEMFGVTQSTIWVIIQRKAWAHVQD